MDPGGGTLRINPGHTEAIAAVGLLLLLLLLAHDG